MIETLSLRNFKVLRSVDVRLRPLTLIVGPNSSGKSTLLQALDFSSQSLARVRVVSPSPPPRRRKRAEGLEYRDIEMGRQLQQLRSHVPAGLVQINFSAKIKSQPYELILSEGGDHLFYGDPSVLRDEKFFASTLDLRAEKLSAPSPASGLLKTLPADGSFLAWVLASLNLEAPVRFSEIVECLQSVVPSVQRLRIRPVVIKSPPETVYSKEKEVIGYELLFDMKGAEGVPAGQVSEGTLVTLAILVLLASPNPPGLVLIENLERGLHPKALRDLVDQIRLLQKQNPSLQVVATSHSPYLLDYLEADEILLTSLAEDGYSSVKVLSEHPEYDRWKDVMAPGEFWSTVGESWVVQKT